MKFRRLASILVLIAFVFETGCSMIPLKSAGSPEPHRESSPTPAPFEEQPSEEDYFAEHFVYPADLDVSSYKSMDADTLRKLLWLRDRQIDIYTQSVDSLFFQVDSLNTELEEAYSRLDVNPDFVIPDTVRFAGVLFDLRNERYRDKFESILKTELRLANVWIPRSGKYFALFDSIFAQTRVPTDVKYLAVAESSLNSMANSWAGAGGVWQFMPSTGKLYKLQINDYIDERRNIILASKAAADYLEDAYDLIATKGARDWLLAFCAYNAGAGRITQVINEQGGKDFFNLIQKVDETNQYVWRSVAIKVIFQNEQQIFGRKLDREEPLLKQGKLVPLNLRSAQNLNDWAKAQGTTISKVWEMNPWIKMHKTKRGRRLTPLNNIILGPGNYQVLIPRNANPDLGQLSRIELSFLERRSNVTYNTSSGSGGYEYYVVRKGDNLGQIASRYGVTVQTLKSLNGLKSNKLRAGQRLKVREIPGQSDENLAQNAEPSKPDSTGKPRPDSLKTTSKKDSTKVVAPKPDSLKAPKADATKIYVVRRGDTLLSISRKLNVTVDYLAKTNNLRDKSSIQVGQKLRY
jgi:membrane-bound lytic murein transglycosylase D